MRDRNPEDTNVAKLQSERGLLRRDAACRRRRFTVVRDVLSALVAMMRKSDELKRPDLKRFSRPSIHRDSVMREQREAELLQSLGRRSHPPAYASRSTLENLVLLQARMKLWGIKAVMIDYGKSESSEGINWRIVGFISGTADRDAARLAITAAAHRYATWVLVDDADPLSGKMVTLGTIARDIA